MERLELGVHLCLLGSHSLLGDNLLLVEPHQFPPFLHLLDLQLTLGLLFSLQFPGNINFRINTKIIKPDLPRGLLFLGDVLNNGLGLGFHLII